MGAAAAVSAGALAGCVAAPKLATAPAPTRGPALVPANPAIAAAPSSLIEEALAALQTHARRIVSHDRIGVADFSLHSSEARFHLVNVLSGKIERSLLVAHGSGSDRGHTGVLQQFSNQPGSHATSRGTYLTADCYMGKYGRSQKLIGLDADNDMALDRAIVVHGAPYVDPALIRAHGRIGRSQGCFAFELHEVRDVMEALGEGRMIYAGKFA
jgi:hypothetical protein